MPVFLYKGVKTNFMGKLAEATKAGKEFKLTNKNKFLEAIFDNKHLVKLSQCDLNKNTIVNCSSAADTTFCEIADVALHYGLSKINWGVADNPSVVISKNKFIDLIGYEPSAREMVISWFQKEIIFMHINQNN